MLSQMQSPVMVNQGDAYVPAEAGMQLNPGDQIIVLQGGQALVNYASGCRVELAGNEMLRVAAEDACSAPALAAVNAQLAPQQSSGGSSTVGGGGSAVVNTAGLIATVGVAGYAAYEISDDDNDDREPISR